MRCRGTSASGVVVSGVMARRCTICAHEKRPDIDRALVAGEKYRDIAGQFGVSRSALVRHSDDHLPASLVKAHDAAEAAQADALLAQVVDLRDKAIGILEAAEEKKDLRSAIAAIREARGCVELLGKLAGQLQDVPVINVFMSAEWQGVQTAILAALEPHADARMAVAKALTGWQGRYDA